MKENYINGRRGSLFMLLEVLFVVAIIAFLSRRVLNTHIKDPGLNVKQDRSLSTQEMAAGSYKSTLDDARETVRVINQQISDRERYINQNIKKAHK